LDIYIFDDGLMYSMCALLEAFMIGEGRAIFGRLAVFCIQNDISQRARLGILACS
jgi:hypothetical protein